MAESPQRGLVMADLEGNDSPTGVNEYGFSPPQVEAAPEISPISAQGSPEFQFSPGSRRSNGRQGITESQESLLAPTNLGNDIDVESEPMIKRSRYEGGKRKTKKTKKSKKVKKTKKSKKSKKSKKVRRG
jgi:hypothetical protein